jgi:hypothetical protein
MHALDDTVALPAGSANHMWVQKYNTHYLAKRANEYKYGTSRDTFIHTCSAITMTRIQGTIPAVCWRLLRDLNLDLDTYLLAFGDHWTDAKHEAIVVNGVFIHSYDNLFGERAVPWTPELRAAVVGGNLQFLVGGSSRTTRVFQWVPEFKSEPPVRTRPRSSCVLL